jgi:hypothetical protein
MSKLRPGGAKKFIESSSMASGYGQFRKMGSIHESHATQGGFYQPRAAADIRKE